MAFLHSSHRNTHTGQSVQTFHQLHLMTVQKTISAHDRAFKVIRTLKNNEDFLNEISRYDTENAKHVSLGLR